MVPLTLFLILIHYLTLILTLRNLRGFRPQTPALTSSENALRHFVHRWCIPSIFICRRMFFLRNGNTRALLHYLNGEEIPMILLNIDGFSY